MENTEKEKILDIYGEAAEIDAEGLDMAEVVANAIRIGKKIGLAEAQKRMAEADAAVMREGEPA